MEPLLEQQRRLHEERERLLDAMVGESLIQQEGQPVSATGPGGQPGAGGVASITSARKPLSHRDKLNSDHRVRAMLDRLAQVS